MLTIKYRMVIMLDRMLTNVHTIKLIIMHYTVLALMLIITPIFMLIVMCITTAHVHCL